MADDTDDVTVDEALDFAADMAETEAESFNGEVPDHADRLLVKRASDVQQTLSRANFAEAKENVEDPDEEDIVAQLEEDAVDILLAVGVLENEHDLDVATAFEERQDFVDRYETLMEALEAAETQEEKVEALDEHMDEELEEFLGMGGAPVQTGDSVDGEEYDHDEVGNAYA